MFTWTCKSSWSLLSSSLKDFNLRFIMLSVSWNFISVFLNSSWTCILSKLFFSLKVFRLISACDRASEWDFWFSHSKSILSRDEKGTKEVFSNMWKYPWMLFKLKDRNYWSKKIQFTVVTDKSTLTSNGKWYYILVKIIHRIKIFLQILLSLLNKTKT